MALCLVFIFDSLFNPFTGIKKKESPAEESDDDEDEVDEAGERRVTAKDLKVNQTMANHKSSNPLDDPILIRDVGFLTKNYLKGGFAFDMLSNVPPLIMMLVYDGVSTPELLEEAQSDPWFATAMLLRLVRLFASNQVTDSVDRLFETLATIFYSKRYTLENIKSWLFAAFKLFIYLHVFACLWLLMYTVKKREDEEHGL